MDEPRKMSEEALLFSKNELSSNGSLKNYTDQLVNELRQDPEVYEQIKKLNMTVGEVRDNIAKLADFKDDYNYCKNCPGIDKCEKNTPHLKMYIEMDGKYLATSFNPCDRMLERIKLESLYLSHDFPDEWRNSSLRTLDLSETRRPVIKEFALICQKKSSRWLYLIGNHKVGKSFLLATFANEFVNQGLGQVAFINATTRIKKLADISYKDPAAFSRQMLMLSDVDLLIIDNFGEEYKNEYIRDQIIIPLLSAREHNDKLTFFASSFSLAEIQKLYSVGKIAGDIRGKQLANVIKEMAKKECDLTGVSAYRK